MYALIKAEDATLATTNEVKTFATMLEAGRAMEREASELLSEIGVCNDAATIGDIINDGQCYGYRGNGFCEIQEPGCGITKWVILQIDTTTKSHMNPNVAETVSYECAGDPRFSSGGVLLHKATVSWNSGKSFDVHAPERVELRIGGTSYEYKAV